MVLKPVIRYLAESTPVGERFSLAGVLLIYRKLRECSGGVYIGRCPASGFYKEDK